ncbi:MAG: riboflavin synthase [Defluviicoccus sp.]|nr:riboflavin synthase [Defluviicoccus sp.]MDE0279269.1 riboflavin synthase [Defluviicoccus sp.]
MFTGIVTDLGRVRAIAKDGDTRFDFETGYDTAEIAIGASIACSGPCLTVVDKAPGRFAVQASAETLARTTLGSWTVGTPVNFERALRIGDELGGHIVSGHVDGVATVLETRAEGDSTRFVFAAPEGLAHYVAPKGSIALDGVSLTVNEVDERGFGVNIIPHTRRHTTFGHLAEGDRVNFEVDTIARYVDRLTARN